MGFREFIPFAIESSKAAGIGVLPDDLTETVTANSPGPTPVQGSKYSELPAFCAPRTSEHRLGVSCGHLYDQASRSGS